MSENQAQPQITIDKEKFKARFHQLDVDNNGRLDASNIKIILDEIGLETYLASIDRIVQKFTVLRLKQLDFPIKDDPDENDDEEQQKIQNNQQIKQQIVGLNLQQALFYASLLNKKIDLEIWKKTATIAQIQQDILSECKKKSHGIKNKPHKAKIEVIVGEALPSYKSYMSAKLQKNNQKYTSDTYQVQIKLKSTNLESSKLFGELWIQLFQLIKGFLTNETPDGTQFLNSLQLSTEETETFFILKIKSKNKILNTFLKSVVGFLDKIFKTQIKAIITLLLQINFDFSDIVNKLDISLYDMFTKNVKLSFQYRASQFITALKQLLISRRSFDDLAYVSTDESTLLLIALVSCYECDLSLKFKNAEYQKAQQQSLMELLGQLQNFRAQLNQFKEEMPQIYELIINAIRTQIEIQGQIGQLNIQIKSNLSGLDKLLVQKPILFEQRNQENQENLGQNPAPQDQDE